MLKFYQYTSQMSYDLHLEKDVYKMCNKFKTTLIFLLP